MKRPNLLFIFTDEQRADTMAAYGNARIETPNLNRLAEGSIVFENAYVTQSVCTPSRSSILTGVWPHTNGCTRNNVPLRDGTPCFPEMLARKYAAAYHGKWHLGDEIFAQHGFREWRAIEDAYRGYYREGRNRGLRSHYHHWLVENAFSPKNGEVFARDEAARLPEEFGKPAFLAREASRFIREHKVEPFVLFVNFLEPHMPFFGPRDGQHDPSGVSLPENFHSPPAEDQHLKARALEQCFRLNGYRQSDLGTEEGWRRLIARYWGLVSLVDTHVGHILRTLEECGLYDETIIVYTSDHGDMMGSRGLLTKCVSFEEAIRVPLLIRPPGLKESRRVKGPVSHIDLVPTLLDLMGEPVPGHLQGRSLGRLAEGKADEPDGADDVFFEWNGSDGRLRSPLAEGVLPPWLEGLGTLEELRAANADPVRSVVTQGGWKFNCSTIGQHELYNLKEDPRETKNLARVGDHLPKMRELRERILAWQERVEDKVELARL